MPVEIRILAYAAILLLAHIWLAIRFKTRQYGAEWNMSARDGPLPPLNPVAARLERARDNYLETLPVAIIALLGVVVAGRTSPVTEIAGWAWLGARVVYLPLYGFGVPKVRTLVWAVALAALVLLLWELLR